MALDPGKVTLESRFDASRPITIGHQTIRHDFHGKGRVLTVPEVFIFSSNIGSPRKPTWSRRGHREFLAPHGPARQDEDGTAGSRQADRTEGVEEGAPITIAFGHGVSTTPLQTAVGAGRKRR